MPILSRPSDSDLRLRDECRGAARPAPERPRSCLSAAALLPVAWVNFAPSLGRVVQEGVFGHEIGFATRPVGGSTAHKGKGFGLEPADDVTLKGIGQSTAESMGEGNHGAVLPFCRSESVSAECGCLLTNCDRCSN